MWMLTLIACGGGPEAPTPHPTGPPKQAPSGDPLEAPGGGGGGTQAPPTPADATPTCDGSGPGTLSGDLGAAEGCAVDGGVMRVPFQVPEGVTLGVQGARMVGGVLEIDLRGSLWASPLPSAPAELVVPPIPLQVSLTSSGGRWEGAISAEPGIDVLASAVAAGPDGLGHADVSDDMSVAMFQIDDLWHVSGGGTSLGDVDLFVVLDEEQGDPTPLPPCTLTDGTELPAVSVPRAYQAINVEGNQVARKRLEGSKVCPAEPVLEEGQAVLMLGPDEAIVRTWVEKLLKRR